MKEARKITKVAREVNKLVNKIAKDSKVGPTEYDVIHIIRKNEGISEKEIAIKLSLDKGALNKIISNLVKKELIIKKKNELDNRKYNLYPTLKAEKLKDLKVYTENIFYNYLINDINEEELIAFYKTLDKIYQKCKNESKNDFQNIMKLIKEDKYEK